MSPAQLLAAARSMVDDASEATEGVWSRAAAHLARQSLESGMKIRLSKQIPWVEEQSFHVQLLCLHDVATRDVAERAAYVWAALSRATHHHGYELPPTAPSLRAWIDAVAEVIDGLGVE